MTVTNKEISDAIESGIQASQTQGVPEWLGATDALITLFVESRECFSSGEIAAHLRTFNPALRFSVTSNLGEHIRDRFYGNSMPLYPNPDGTFSPIEMTPRMTAGFTRTPPGTQVFVYGPDNTSCVAHPFEVEIPAPGTTVAPAPGDAHGLPARPVQAPVPVSHFVTLQPRKSHVDLRATVHADGRCCVPRSILEELLYETQAGLKGGDPLYVLVDNAAQQARIGLDRENGAQAYSVWATTGRCYFPNPAHPFTPGDCYAVTVDGPGRRLVVDISKPL